MRWAHKRNYTVTGTVPEAPRDGVKPGDLLKIDGDTFLCTIVHDNRPGFARWYTVRRVRDGVPYGRRVRLSLYKGEWRYGIAGKKVEVT